MPIYATKHWLTESTATVPLYLRSRNELLDEMDALKKELALSNSRDSTLARLSAENESLRSLLHTEERGRIAASVIARPPFIPYDALLLDRGSNDGIHEDAVVFLGEDQAIGIVSRVFGKTSLVTLFSSPGIETTVYVFGPDIYTTAYGEGGGVVRVSVPQGILLESGNIVVMPTLDAGVLGLVTEVVSVSTQPEQHGYVVREIPTQSLKTVTVSTQGLETISFEEAQENVDNHRYEVLKIEVPEEIIVDVTATSTSLDPQTEEDI